MKRARAGNEREEKGGTSKKGGESKKDRWMI